MNVRGTEIAFENQSSLPLHHTSPTMHAPQVLNVLGFKLPFYSSPTLLLSTAISLRVLWSLWAQRPHVIHVSTPGVMVFAATLYAKLLRVPLVMSYHTHIPEYIPRYTWQVRLTRNCDRPLVSYCCLCVFSAV